MTNESLDPYDHPRTKELLYAANEGARIFRTTFVSFVLVTLYFLIVALSADDELLFLDGQLRTPILNVGVTASHFFIATPWLLLVLHLNLLLQGVFLAQKVADYRSALPTHRSQHDEMLRLLFPTPLAQLAQAGSRELPPWLLKLFAFTVMTTLPLVALGVTQTQFLDFQHRGVTAMQSIVLLLDFALVWCLWPKVRRPYTTKSDADPWLAQATTFVVTFFFRRIRNSCG